jgi:hypothetical protein
MSTENFDRLGTVTQETTGTATARSFLVAVSVKHPSLATDCVDGPVRFTAVGKKSGARNTRSSSACRHGTTGSDYDGFAKTDWVSGLSFINQRHWYT